ncbi:MAG: HEAT repeat domain-containing protein, partial [Planctomycetes bacterium]|nr:HEAT repeat domain-containing protein [Planctomycetota bacterium]
MSKLPGISLRLLFAAALLACFTIAPASHAEPAGADDGPGIAILASSVDNGESVEDLLSFVKEARVREVVIDWAWITLHWEHTKFDRVNALVEKLKAEKVHVAAMYRPRFKAFQAKTYTIKAQVNADGQLPDGREILYADPEARKWGTQWAVDILTKCPAFDEVVIYNPSQFDQSEASKNARKKNADYDNDSVHKFLEETRKAIREVKQDAKLGLVRPPAEWAFKPFRDVVDVDRPYAVVRDDTDFDKNMDAALNVMSQTKTAGPALAKITWGEDYKVSDEKLAEFIKTARKKKLRYCFWTFDTTFLEGNYDLDSLCKAAGLDAGKLKSIIRDLGGKTDLKFPAEEVQKAVDDAMDEPGYTAVLEAVKKYGEQVIGPMTKILDDTERSVVDRWRAAGALGQTKSPKALEVLLRNSKDKEDMVRWLCADGIGWCGKGSKEARERLKEMGENDPAMRKDQKGETVYYVRDTAKRALAKLSQREPGEEEAFFKNMPWAETLEDALDRAKKENKLVVLFVNPFDNPAYECGYRGADNYAKEQRAKQKDEPRPDVGQVKERAMLAGLLCEPRNAAFVRQRCVLVRMRLHYRHWTDVYNDEPHALKAVGMDDKNVGAPAVLAISPEGKIVAHAHDMTIYCPELFWKIAATAMEACELSTPEPLKQAQDALAKNDGPENFIALLNAQLDAGEHKDFRKLAALAPKKAADEATLLQAEADLVEGNAQSAFDRLENFKAPNDRFHARKNALLAEALVRLGRPEEADGLYRATVHGTLPMDGVLWRLLFFDCLAKDRLGKTEGRSEMPGGSWADEEDPWCVRALMYHQPNGPNPDEWCRFTDLP